MESIWTRGRKFRVTFHWIEGRGKADRSLGTPRPKSNAESTVQGTLGIMVDIAEPGYFLGRAIIPPDWLPFGRAITDSAAAAIADQCSALLLQVDEIGRVAATIVKETDFTYA